MYLRQKMINIKIQHKLCPKYGNTKLREILKDVFMPKQIERLIFKNKNCNSLLNFKEGLFIFAEECWSTVTWIINYLKIYSQPEVFTWHPKRITFSVERECLTVLSFDKMIVDSRLCYDQREDRIMGPHANAQKQPILYDLHKNITKDKLFKVIKEVEEYGFKVVATVSDTRGRNLSLWKNLQISTNKVSFMNPLDVTLEVRVFADIPHLIKQSRNNFLDYGIRLPCRTEVSNWQLEQILHNKEISRTLKLDSRVHFNVSGSAQQKVKYAMQLFSHHTATVLKRKFLQKPQISKFFDLVDKWFDNCKRFRKPWHSAFGIHFQEQAQILNDVKDVVENMSVIGKTSLMPFQKGIIVSIKYLTGLYNYLISSENLKYVITCHLNQGVLENLFLGYVV
ncbi:hypothetical protein PR048_023384 [Dryococelus australis]|uniref:Transposase n=1 Tax=Dryococelus australis TaxID=614101 RepID=A0ABQ9GU08_9NEOP|nr:hypothetical protein PR048_023384 [Dryococelus australis]